MSELFELFKKIQVRSRPTGPVEHLVACLGNPGRRYENSRHNVGFVAADYIARTRGFSIDRLRFQSLCGECVVGGRKVLFLKPSTFMNLSGQAVVEAMSFYKIPVERLLVICDDVALPPGRLRVRPGGSAGGQNGLKNIIYLTGSDAFARARVGVGQKPYPDYDLADWVLGTPDAADRKRIEEAIVRLDGALELLIAGDLSAAMNRCNGA